LGAGAKDDQEAWTSLLARRLLLYAKAVATVRPIATLANRPEQA
jgi:hypothetical protein